jgi:hypothetical protein
VAKCFEFLLLFQTFISERARTRRQHSTRPQEHPREDGFLVSSTIPFSIYFFAFPGGPRREHQNRQQNPPSKSRQNLSNSFSTTSFSSRVKSSQSQTPRLALLPAQLPNAAPAHRSTQGRRFFGFFHYSNLHLFFRLPRGTPQGAPEPPEELTHYLPEEPVPLLLQDLNGNREPRAGLPF